MIDYIRATFERYSIKKETEKMPYYNEFQYCPICGSKYTAGSFDENDYVFNCSNCKKSFFQNSKPGVDIIIPYSLDPNKILLMKRYQKPNIGKFDLPGGFLKYNERPEDAAIREIKEELNIDIRLNTYLTYKLVEYRFKNVYHSVITFAYIAEPIDKIPESVYKRENSCAEFFDTSTILEDKFELAWQEDKNTITKYLHHIHNLT